MDKTDILWYNTDMNEIVAADNIHGLLNKKISGCFTVIVPAEGGKGGEISWKKDDCKNKIVFTAKNVIVIPPSTVYNLTLHSPEDCIEVFIERALLQFKDVTVVPDDKNCGIRHAAKQAQAYVNGNADKSELILAALGTLLVSYLTAFADGDDLSPVTKLVIDDISKNLSDMTYSLEDFLKKLPLNYDYVRKLFKKETGETPHAYLLRQRMELAANILSGGLSNKYSAYTVSQVAEACGFSEPPYFSRVFKKYYGVAPSDYAKKL